jgi:alginate O-acetyltransferase complex protein AlgI
MLFSSLEFLFLFLPVVLALYFAVPMRFKNLLLLAGSLFFYAWGEPVYVVLMVVSIAVNYFLALVIERNRGTKTALAAVIGSIGISLLFLAFFKYADFVIETLNGLPGVQIPDLDLPLPIGISFYTFQILSYTVDVYRGNVEAQRDFITLAMYISLFPQLIAGPIVRYRTIVEDLARRTHTMEGFAEGAQRFTVGLAKKVIVADNIGLLWTAALEPSEPSVLLAWLGVIGFAFQIYFDFSGYSDMAIGLGRMFGFRFPENFNYPYISRSVTEFWRRWHISLGRWFRDYVYIPLGGNRVSYVKWIRNVFVVWFLTGLWHGAAWNFAIWGVYFGILLWAERTFLAAFLERLPRFVGHLYLLVAVLFSWVVFQLETPAQIFGYFADMFALGGLPAANAEAVSLLRSNLVLLVVAVIGATPLAKRLADLAIGRPAVRRALAPAVNGLLLVVSYGYLVDSTFSPFLYFRF